VPHPAVEAILAASNLVFIPPVEKVLPAAPA